MKGSLIRSFNPQAPNSNGTRTNDILRKKPTNPNGGNVFNITFAPTINGGDADSNRKMLEEEMSKFKQMMDEYFNEKARLAY